MLDGSTSCPKVSSHGGFYLADLEAPLFPDTSQPSLLHLLSVSCSPHPVKPLSAASVEGSPDRKPSRSSLSTALSSGLERLRTVTSGSVQPVAPAPQVASAVDAKRLKVRPHQVQSCGGRSGVQLWGWAGSGDGHLWGTCMGNRGASVSEAIVLTLLPPGLRTLGCWTSLPSTTT